MSLNRATASVRNAAALDALEPNYEDWERSAGALMLELQGAGRAVCRLPIHVDALAAWCRARSRPLDSAARAEYVSDCLRHQLLPNADA